MKLSGAIDLHSNDNVIVVSDEQDRVVCENRLPNEATQVALRLHGTGLNYFTGCFKSPLHSQ